MRNAALILVGGWVMACTSASPAAAPDATVDVPPMGVDDVRATAVDVVDASSADLATIDAPAVDAITTDAGALDAPPADVPVGPWRSRLYPTAWRPADTSAEGHFLHDFSYAGYHNGVGPLGARVPSMQVDVTTRGADATGAHDATAAVQGAIDAVSHAGGGVVLIPAGLYRIDGVLRVTASNVVLRGAGSTQTRLYFTRTTGMAYDSHLALRGALTSDLEVALSVEGVPREDSVVVADARTLAVGDDIQIGWTITPEFIAEHGMTGVWTAFNDHWEPFFHRHVVALEPVTGGVRVRLDVPLRYPAKLRDHASIRRVRGMIREVGVEALALSNAVAWHDAWAFNQVHVLELSGVADGWVRDVATFSSPLAPTGGNGAGAHLQSSGAMVLLSKRVTFADSRMELAENRGDNGNGYLWELRQSSEVLWRDLVGRAGRHNFIQNWGFGVTGCVWLRVHSSEGQQALSETLPIGLITYSEFHHSLATANLIDDSTFDDGVSTVNRGSESTGAGITGTQSVFWNTQGRGVLRSFQFGVGYVIGTRGVTLEVDPIEPFVGDGTAPVDYLEGANRGAGLDPPSLYDDQLRRRTMP